MAATQQNELFQNDVKGVWNEIYNQSEQWLHHIKYINYELSFYNRLFNESEDQKIKKFADDNPQRISQFLDQLVKIKSRIEGDKNKLDCWLADDCDIDITEFTNSHNQLEESYNLFRLQWRDLKKQLFDYYCD